MLNIAQMESKQKYCRLDKFAEQPRRLFWALNLNHPRKTGAGFRNKDRVLAEDTEEVSLARTHIHISIFVLGKHPQEVRAHSLLLRLAPKTNAMEFFILIREIIPNPKLKA